MNKIYITADPHGNYLHLKNILTNPNVLINALLKLLVQPK